MRKEYGDRKGESVFYASANSGKLTGVHERLREAGRGLKRAKRRQR
jgi:hypothetical protein